MQIKILGTRGEIKPTAPGHANHSGIILDSRIMFDLGEEKFLAEKPECVFITHLHPDHAFFARRPFIPPLSTRPAKLQQSGKGRLGLPREAASAKWDGVKIFAPEKNELCPQIKIISKSITISGYKITPLPTIHSRNVKSQAYLIEAGEKKILYTGDMIWIKKRLWKFLQNLNLVITEGSFIKSGGMINRDPTSPRLPTSPSRLRGTSRGAGKITGELWGHQGIPDLIKFFSQFTKQIIITHFGSWFYKDIKSAEKEIKQLGRQNGIEVKVGYDGMKISL